MNRRRKKSTYNLIWVPIMLLIFGSAFLISGVFAYLQMTKEGIDDGILFLVLFGGMGSLVIVGSLVALTIQIRKRLRKKTLMNTVAPELIPIFSVDYVSNVRINNRNPLQITCHTVAPNGDIYILKSGYLTFDPQPYLQNNRVLVYRDSENPSNYFIDVDESLQNNIFEV